MTPEGKVKAKVSKRLKELGADCWRFMPVQTGYGLPALDYLNCIKGHFVAIETKVEGKHLTPRQVETKGSIEAAGGIVFVVDNDESLDFAMASIALMVRSLP